MELDPRITGLAIGLVSALIMTAAHLINGRESWTGLWVAATVTAAAGTLVRMLPFSPGLFPVGYAVSVAAAFFFLEGILRFRGLGKSRRRTFGLSFAFVLWTGLQVIAGDSMITDSAGTSFLLAEVSETQGLHDLVLAIVSVGAAFALVYRTKGLELFINGLTAVFFLLPAVGFACRFFGLLSAEAGVAPGTLPAITLVSLFILLHEFGRTCGLCLSVNLRARRTMEFLARHDPLTGLSNRRALMEFASATALQCDRLKIGFGIAVLNINGFRHLNRDYGHGFGDEVLVNLSRTLSNVVRKTDLVARMEDDEFTVLFTNLNVRTELYAAVDRLRTSVSSPLVVGDHEVIVTFSLGSALYPEDGAGLDMLLTVAGEDLRGGKKRGRQDSLVVS